LYQGQQTVVCALNAIVAVLVPGVQAPGSRVGAYLNAPKKLADGD
jgi:hypothetical protein